MRKRPSGRAYQELVASIVKAFDPGAQVEVGEWIEGPDGRLDMDVSIRGNFDGRPRLAVIECKDFDVRKTGKVGRPFVDALDSKRSDLHADFALICSNSGFTSDALRKAKRKQIGMISVLRKGDKRVKVRIKEEIYFRIVKLGQQTFSYTGRNLRPKVRLERNDVKYVGRPVDAWLSQRAAFIACSQPTGSGQVNAKFRFAVSAIFDVQGIPTVLDSISVSCSTTSQWFAQTIELDAKKGIYDYLRRRVALVRGANEYLIKGVNFDEGTPIDFTPPKAERGVGLMPGEIDDNMVMVHGTTFSSESEIPDLSPLIVPIDLV